ncbi:MAG: protoporphyrinogen oxidase [Rhodoferax sp.]
MYFDHDVVVLGAGISGLTVAHALVQRGFDVRVYDRRPVVGGRIQTLRQNGFLVENGPTSMISPAPGADALMTDLGLGAQRIGKTDRVRHRYLVRDGRAHALPMSPGGFFASSFFSVAGRLRMLAEPFIHCGPADESIADFVSRRFGREMLDYVFDPLVGGLYSANPTKLSIQAVFPQLKGLEQVHGSVLRGVIASRLSRCGASSFDPRRRQLTSLRDGMGSLPTRIETLLDGRIVCGVRAEAIARLPGGGYRIALREGDGVTHCRVRELVVALPAYAAARLITGLDDEAGSFLGGIHHPPMAVLGLGYRSPDVTHPLDGLGVLNPSGEKRATLGLMFSSSLFAGRAPVGHELITAYVGGARQPELARLPREELLALVQGDVRDLLGASAPPVFSSVRYWPQGLPQPQPGHVEQVATLRARLAEVAPGLHLAGNYLAGVSTVACIATALTAARGVCAADGAQQMAGAVVRTMSSHRGAAARARPGGKPA